MMFVLRQSLKYLNMFYLIFAQRQSKEDVQMIPGESQAHSLQGHPGSSGWAGLDSQMPESSSTHHASSTHHGTGWD